VHEVPGYQNHRENSDDPLEEQYGPSHVVNLVPGGILHGLARASTVMVKTLHSQGVARLANGVSVEALADDGLVEAFKVDSAKGFTLSVQWHPEWRVTLDDFSMAIFRTFGNACKAYAAKRQV
jgi:putative glutamine amidotransferase